MNLSDLQKNWQDTPEYHSNIHELFIELSKGTYLEAHRKWVRENVFGFGEDSFPCMWKILIDEMPDEFTFCEIGCFKMQTVTLVRLISDNLNKKVHRVCVSPMDTSGGMWDDDYFAHSKTIHDKFEIPEDYVLCHGISTDGSVIKKALSLYPFDICYVDGAHDFETALFDLITYGNMVKSGGYLVIDDSNTNLNMQFGYFQGIDTVTEAKLRWLETEGSEWEFVCSVVHVSVYRRK